MYLKSFSGNEKGCKSNFEKCFLLSGAEICKFI